MLGLIIIQGTKWPSLGLVPILYLDPGSGSMIIQLIIAGALGALFIFRGAIRKIVAKFRRPGSQVEEKKDDDDW